ncbi:MAG: hypothetical protein ABEJ07_02515 [Candidatus Nanohaloarchaea archaeon]
MEEEKLEHRLAVYSLAINSAGLFFAAAALVLWGPVAALAVFGVSVISLLYAVYRKKVV